MIHFSNTQFEGITIVVLNLAKKIQYWVITLQFNNKLFVKAKYSKQIVLCQK